MATFIGAGGIRNYVIGKDDRPATRSRNRTDETARRHGDEQGALGLSTSLQYVPDRFASDGEIIELAKVAARYGGRLFLTLSDPKAGPYFRNRSMK